MHDHRDLLRNVFRIVRVTGDHECPPEQAAAHRLEQTAECSFVTRACTADQLGIDTTLQICSRVVGPP